MNTRQNLKRVMAAGFFIASTTGCALLAPYNQYSFDETARLKVESRALITKAREPYWKHAVKADSVLRGVRSAYQDAALRSQNQASMRRWEILMDSTQESLAGSLARWRRQGTLLPEDIRAARIIISQDFDVISKLEGNKGK